MKTVEIERDTIEHGTVKPVHVIERRSKSGESWETIIVFRRRVIEVQCGVTCPKIPMKFDADRVEGEGENTWVRSGMHMTFPDWKKIDTIPGLREKMEAVSEAAIEASGFYCYDGGAGRAFAAEPSVNIKTRYIVVRQSGGLDI